MRKVQSSTELYISEVFAKESLLMQTAKRNAQKINKDSISVSAVEGSILALLTRLTCAHKVIELGTLTGYSALWFLSAMNRGDTLWTFEKNPEIAKMAHEVFEEYRKYGFAEVHLLEGDAEEKLTSIENEGPFDLVFIDANKAAYGRYLEWSVRNLRSGGLLVADNVLLNGDVLNDSHFNESERPTHTGIFSEKQIRVMREFNHRVGSQIEFHSTMLPTYEGLVVGIKK